MRKKNNRKLYAITVIPVIAILYFLTANPLQDDSMWDISTNEYYQQGANFELFAVYCSPFWTPTFCESVQNQTPSTPSTPSTPIETTNFSCKSNIVMYYKDDQRNTWRQYGDTWTNIGSLDLSSVYGGKITDIKGDAYIKCDWSGNGEIQLKSGTARTTIVDGFLFGTGAGSGEGTGGLVGLSAQTGNLDKNVDLKKKVRTFVGTVVTLDESDIATMENYLKPISNGKFLGITFGVTLDPTFKLNGNKISDPTTYQHKSSMKFSKLLEAPTGTQTQSNSMSSPITIEKIETSIGKKNLKNNMNELDTTRDDMKYNQILILTSMTKYLSDEGSPLITITSPSNTQQKFGTTLGTTSSDGKQFFKTYWTLPYDSQQGEWTVSITNVNRSGGSTATFYVQNTATTTTTTTTTTTATTNPDELKDLEDLKVGVMWTAKDGNGRTISGVGGNSITDGNAVTPMLSLDISQIIDDRYLDQTTPFSQINIQPIIQFDSDDAFVEMKNYRFSQNNNPLGITIELSIPDDQSAGTIPRQIQMMPQGNGEMLILGFGTLTQSNADTLAETAGYEVGDRFTVEAKIGGNFELTSQKTNNDYQFTFDDVKLTQTFQYGVIGTDLDPADQKLFDEKWDKCIADGKVPKNLGNLRQECITQEEVQKRQCEDDSEGDAGKWNSNREMCEVPNIVNGSEVPITSTSSEEEIDNAIDSCESVQGQNWDKGTNMCIKITTTETPIPKGDTEPETKITATNGNLQLCGSNQSITECIADLQAPSLLDDNVIIIIVIAITILIVIAIISSRRQNRSYGLMNRY